jgi:hypothetical protein
MLILKIYHLKCSFTEQFLLITFLTVAVAATKSCARKTKAIALAPAKSKDLLFFHDFTGCDVVSAFCG